MNRLHQAGAIATTLCLLSPVALACGTCVKDILSGEEFDSRAWDQSAHVFIALVTATRLAEDRSGVEYTFSIDEVLKGHPTQTIRVHSARTVSDWKDVPWRDGAAEGEDIALDPVSCGHLAISSGDRLLVFAGSDGVVGIGECSASRVIQGSAAEDAESVLETLKRARAWSQSQGARGSPQ